MQCTGRQASLEVAIWLAKALREPYCLKKAKIGYKNIPTQCKKTMHQAKHRKADTTSKMVAVLQLIVFTAAMITSTKPTLICALQMRTFSS